MASPDTGADAGWEGSLVAAADAGTRLDRWLAEELAAQVSRNRVKAWIEAGEVLVNGEPSAPSRKLAEGDRVEWRLRVEEDAQPQSEKIKLNVLYEDPHLIVIDKPAGMTVHPGAGNRTGTLVNALLHHCGGRLSSVGGPDRPGIVHRIDKDTSGVMVVARDDETHLALAAAFADHGRNLYLERRYAALVWGVPDPVRGTIRMPLGRAPDRVRRAVVPASRPDSRAAVTHYRILESFFRASMVECELETGRTHQIRVHMAHAGHPVIGDPLYGRGFASKARTLPTAARALAESFPRQALHAAVLGIVHPVSGERMRFESRLPSDMAALAESLRNISPRPELES